MFQIGVTVKNKNRVVNSVDPDETAHHEPSHQDVHCFQNKFFWPAELKGLIRSVPHESAIAYTHSEQIEYVLLSGRESHDISLPVVDTELPNFILLFSFLKFSEENRLRWNENSVDIVSLTHLCLVSHKRDIGKQWRPRLVWVFSEDSDTPREYIVLTNELGILWCAQVLDR